MPPSAPATVIAGTSQAWLPPPKVIASHPAAIAPMVNMPSAPIFHTLARMPIVMPSPIRIRGEALSSHSEMPFAVDSGSMKKMRSVFTGLRPSAAKRTELTTTVRASAIIGAPIRMKGSGAGRGSSTIFIIQAAGRKDGSTPAISRPISSTLVAARGLAGDRWP